MVVKQWFVNVHALITNNLTGALMLGCVACAPARELKLLQVNVCVI